MESFAPILYAMVQAVLHKVFEASRKYDRGRTQVVPWNVMRLRESESKTFPSIDTGIATLSYLEEVSVGYDLA